jgi:hypothetical protein
MASNFQFFRALRLWWNQAVLGSDQDGTVKYIYIPSPPAMFPVAAIVPVRIEEEESAEIAFEGLWREGRTA